MEQMRLGPAKLEGKQGSWAIVLMVSPSKASSDFQVMECDSWYSVVDGLVVSKMRVPSIWRVILFVDADRALMVALPSMIRGT